MCFFVWVLFFVCLLLLLLFCLFVVNTEDTFKSINDISYYISTSTSTNLSGICFWYTDRPT